MTTAPVKFDTKAFIASQAEESGMTHEDAVLFADKCYDAMPIWQPYGGAESFEDIEAKQASDLYQGNVNQLNYGLQSIITNVMQNENLSSSEKAARIKDAATAFEERISALDISKGPPTEGTKSLTGSWLESIKAKLKKRKGYQGTDPSTTTETDPVVSSEKRDVSTDERKNLAKKGEALPDGSFPIASVSDLKNAIQAIGRAKNPGQAKAHIKKMARKLGAADQLPEGWKSMDEDETLELGDGFKMFVDANDNLRWVAFSTNAFEDHSKELFSTKAIEDAVAWHDQQADRGPLRIFHVDGADIGKCDFQAVQGRFLIESGTFDNTPMGQKAVQYFEEHPEEEWQISVGYWYKEGDDADGTLDWVRWKERSVLPAGRADNPYTGFWTNLNKVGEKEMHQAAKDTLTKLVGEDLAKDFITRADTATKELEASGVRFKMKEDEFGDITDVEELPDEGEKAKPEPILMAHEHGPIRHKHRVLPDSEHGHTGLEVAFKAMPAAMQAAIDKKKADAEDAKDGGKDDADENADGSKKTGKKEIDPGFAAMAEVLSTLVGDVAEIKEVLPAVKELQTGLKELQSNEEDRMSSFLNTRATLPGGVRPSSLDTNLVDGTAPGVKELVDDGASKAPVNPAQIYVEDLFGKNTSAVRLQNG